MLAGHGDLEKVGLRAAEEGAAADSGGRQRGAGRRPVQMCIAGMFEKAASAALFEELLQLGVEI